MKKYIKPNIRIINTDELCCVTGSKNHWGSHSHNHHHHHYYDDYKQDDEYETDVY